MKINHVLITLLLFINIVSCSKKLVYMANEENIRYIGSDGWRYKVDADIHLYNVNHDTALLYSTLAYLGNIPTNNNNKTNLLIRKLTVLRLLHKYDTVIAILDTCSDDVIGSFGKTKELLITRISHFNHYQQFKERDQKIDELIAYMEYCFERQNMVDNGDESIYLQKYKDNQLALSAVATRINPYTLNWYLGSRLLRGDNKTDIELLIENYYQMGLINDVGKDWLWSLLDGNYEEKDFDSRL